MVNDAAKIEIVSLVLLCSSRMKTSLTNSTECPEDYESDLIVHEACAERNDAQTRDTDDKSKL